MPKSNSIHSSTETCENPKYTVNGLLVNSQQNLDHLLKASWEKTDFKAESVNLHRIEQELKLGKSESTDLMETIKTISDKTHEVNDLYKEFQHLEHQKVPFPLKSLNTILYGVSSLYDPKKNQIYDSLIHSWNTKSPGNSFFENLPRQTIADAICYVGVGDTTHMLGLELSALATATSSIAAFTAGTAIGGPSLGAASGALVGSATFETANFLTHKAHHYAVQSCYNLFKLHAKTQTLSVPQAPKKTFTPPLPPSITRGAVEIGYKTYKKIVEPVANALQNPQPIQVPKDFPEPQGITLATYRIAKSVYKHIKRALSQGPVSLFDNNEPQNNANNKVFSKVLKIASKPSSSVKQSVQSSSKSAKQAKTKVKSVSKKKNNLNKTPLTINQINQRIQQVSRLNQFVLTETQWQELNINEQDFMHGVSALINFQYYLEQTKSEKNLINAFYNAGNYFDEDLQRDWKDDYKTTIPVDSRLKYTSSDFINPLFNENSQQENCPTDSAPKELKTDSIIFDQDLKFYSEVMQGAQLLSQIASHTKNSNLQMAAGLITSSITMGFASAALWGNAAALAALSVSNPILLAGMVIGSAMGIINILGNSSGNEDNGLGLALQQIHENILQIQQMLIQNQKEIHQRLDRLEQYNQITIDLVKNSFQIMLQQFDYLEQSFNIPTTLRLKYLEDKIDAKFAIQDAKIGRILLQPLLKIFHEIKPYLTSIAQDEYLKPELFTQYMGVLSGYLTEDVRDELFTHEVILNENPNSQHPQLVYETLEKANQHRENVPNYLGVIFAYMRNLDILSSENFPQKTIFNAVIWYQTLQKYLAIKDQFSQFSYDVDQVELAKIRQQALAFQSLLEHLNKPEIVQKLWIMHEASAKELESVVKQVIENSEHRLVQNNLEHILKGFSEQISPMKPNYQPIYLQRTLSSQFMSQSATVHMLNEGILGFDATKSLYPWVVSANYEVPRYYSSGDSHHRYSVKTDCRTNYNNCLDIKMLDNDLNTARMEFVNPLTQTGNDKNVFHFLANKGLQIPAEALLTELWGGYFVTHFSSSLLRYETDLSPRPQTVKNNAKQRNHLAYHENQHSVAYGLKMVIHLDSQRKFDIFKPKSGYLYDFRRTDWHHPKVPEPVGEILNSYEQPALRTTRTWQKEWELFQQHATDIVLTPPDISNTRDVLRADLNNKFLAKRKVLALTIINEVEQSPALIRLLAIEQLMISYAISQGFPEELCSKLITLFSSDKLSSFRQHAYKKTSLETPFVLNSVDTNVLHPIRQDMLVATTTGGLTAHYLRKGLLLINQHWLKVVTQQPQSLQNIVDKQKEILQDNLHEVQKIIAPLIAIQDYVPHKENLDKIFEDLINSNAISNNSFLFNLSEAPIIEKPIVNVEESISFAAKEVKSPLQTLCASKEAPITQIIQLLSEFERKQLLDRELNHAEEAQRPIHLAIKAQRLDVIKLLLEHGSLTSSYSVQLINQTVKNELRLQMTALVSFYQAIEAKSSELNAFSVKRTLGLINTIATELSPLNTQNDAVLLMGDTGDGKSTLANFLMGVDYELAINDGQVYLKPQAGSLNEFCKTSSSSVSETSIPQVVQLNNQFSLIDMPGLTDNRGLAFQIANGFSAQLLSKVFSSIRALVLVIDAAAIYQTRSSSINQSLNVFAKMINQQIELIPNILIFVNKAQPAHLLGGAAAIKKRLNRWLEENSNLDLGTQFLLNHLQEEQIFLINVPRADIRTKIINHMNALSAKKFSSFNLSHYHREVAHFRHLLMQMQGFQKERCSQLIDLSTSIGHSLIQKIANSTTQLEQFTLFNKEQSIEKLGKEEESLKAIFLEQSLQKNSLFSFLNATQHFVSSHLIHANANVLLYGPQLVQQLKQMATTVRIAQQFLDHVKSVVDVDNQNDACAHLSSFKSESRHSFFANMKSKWSDQHSNNQLVSQAEQNFNVNVQVDWDDRLIHFHPKTRKPIFVAVSYDQQEILGTASFYGEKNLCRSLNGDRHNLIHSTGNLIGIESYIDSSSLRDICNSLPPTLSERAGDAALGGAKMGLVSGLSSVFHSKLKNQGYSDFSAFLMSRTAYYGAFATVKFTEHYWRMKAEQDLAEIPSAIFATAVDTGSFLIINFALMMINVLFSLSSQAMERKQWQRAATIIQSTGKMMQWGIFALHARSEGVAEMGTSLLTGAATQALVEKMI